MPAIGNVSLGGVPRVALAVGGHSPDLEGARAAGVSILEARLDLFGRDGADYARAELGRLRALGLPLVLTCRTAAEGGRWTGAERARLALLLACLPLADALDVELEADGINAEAAREALRAGKTLIVSRHWMDATPEDAELEARFDAAKRLGADIVKLACLAREPGDVLRLLNLVSRRRREGVVGISMGPLGALSRVAAPLFGSLLTYVGQEINYGQLPLDGLVRTLKLLYPEFREAHGA